MSEIGNIETPQIRQVVELNTEFVKMADKIKIQLSLVGKHILNAIHKYGLEVPGDNDEDEDEFESLQGIAYSLHKLTMAINQ